MKDVYGQIIRELLNAVFRDEQITEDDQKIVLSLIADLKRMLYVK